MAVYTLTLANVRTRCEHKLRDDQSSSRLDEWINDVVQQITSEIFFDELLSDITDISGDGSKQSFDLAEDFAAFNWVYSDETEEPLIEVSYREMVEEYPSMFDGNVQTPRWYCLEGRIGTVGDNGVPKFKVRFDSVIPSGDVVKHVYYRMHPELVTDSDYILLPQNLLPTIVDGVLLESDSWNDSDQFQIHRDRFLDKMNQLKRNQNRRPNKRRTMGRGILSGRPARPGFPANYPNVWNQ